MPYLRGTEVSNALGQPWYSVGRDPENPKVILFVNEAPAKSNKDKKKPHAAEIFQFEKAPQSRSDSL